MSILGEINKEPKDEYKEHKFHQGIHYVMKDRCSECYKNYSNYLKEVDFYQLRRASQ